MKAIIYFLLITISINIQAQEHVVDQKNKTFLPSTMKLEVGDTIRFKNSDPFAHNAYADDKANEFDVGMQFPNKDKVIKMKKAGKFNVECAIHPNMLIEVEVVE
ncbi:MAG: cupredoxin domain-containing protein [Sulfurimonas sp.]|nr:cupredoxin domain-containing protein [Sulfurimonas sp.]